MADGAPDVDALVFDLDGVLVDTGWGLERVWRALFGLYGGLEAVVAFDAARAAGRLEADPTELLLRVARRSVDTEQLDRDHAVAWATLSWNGLPATPGSLALLRSAKRAGIKIGVATNAQDWHAERHLVLWEVAGEVDAVSAVWGTAMEPKPAPDVYLDAVGRLGVTPHRAVAIEDSQVGVAAARLAGLTTIGLAGGRGSREDLSDADAVVPTLREVTVARLRGLIVEVSARRRAAD